MKESTMPAVFWHSDPVGPNETLVISGGGFSPDAIVEIAAEANTAHEPKWGQIEPLQASDHCLKAVLPASAAYGVYACRVRQGDALSKTFHVNAPDIWWKQGDAGLDKARLGGWLRILGKCLDSAGRPSVTLIPQGGGNELRLELESISCYSVKALIPASLAPGSYKVAVDGFEAGLLEALPQEKTASVVLDVMKMGADPTGMKDSTAAVVAAIERLSCLGGGVILFPRGRYRIDSILRSGTWIEAPLLIPEKICLRGEGADLTSLWWPDREKPLPTLIEGHSDFAIEDMSIYTQGRHSTIISGVSNARIRNVRIRANCHYMTGDNGRAHHGRKVEAPGASGSAILLWGENNQVTGCDIFCSALAFDIRIGRGSLIAGNEVRAHNFHFMSGISEMIFENNKFCGNSLSADGSNIALHFGASICKHVYYAGNECSHLYGCDHECLTFDGHGLAFLGKVKDVAGASLRLVRGRKPLKKPVRGHMADMHGTAIYIIDGCGAGQYRWVESYEGDLLKLDRPWDIEPDASSLLYVGGFNGRHLIIGNKGSDVGSLVQLYPTNCECIVAGNSGIRTSNMNSLSRMTRDMDTGIFSAEVSWRNQFLDNHIIAGNGWGGGSSAANRWLGGEAALNIWGWQVSFTCPEASDYEEFLTPGDLMACLGESTPRLRSIPISCFQIVRRHIIGSNSSIRVHGRVSDVLIEGCLIKDSRKGIRIDDEIYFKQPQDCGQTFNFDPEPSAQNPPLKFLCPDGVLLRDNSFSGVEQPYSGTALDEALLLEPSRLDAKELERRASEPMARQKSKSSKATETA